MALTALVTGCQTAPNAGLGPMPVRSGSIFSPARLTIRAEAPNIDSAFRGSVGVDLAEGNHHMTSPGAYLVDAETTRLEVRQRYTLADRLVLGVDMSASARQAGFLDGIIQGWHSAFDQPQDGRDLVPHDQVTTQFTLGGTTYDLNDEGVALEDAVLSAAYTLTAGDEYLPAVSMALSMRAPTHTRDRYGSDGVDIMLGVSMAKRLHEKFFAYAGLAYTRHGDGAWGPLPVRRDTWSGFMALEYQPIPDLSFIAQTMMSTPVTDALPDLNRPPIDLMAYLRWRRQEWIYSIGALENTDNKNDVDFGLVIDIERRF
jgi:hypothetical protein